MKKGGTKIDPIKFTEELLGVKLTRFQKLLIRMEMLKKCKN